MSQAVFMQLSASWKKKSWKPVTKIRQFKQLQSLVFTAMDGFGPRQRTHMLCWCANDLSSWNFLCFFVSFSWLAFHLLDSEGGGIWVQLKWCNFFLTRSCKIFIKILQDFHLGQNSAKYSIISSKALSLSCITPSRNHATFSVSKYMLQKKLWF